MANRTHNACLLLAAYLVAALRWGRFLVDGSGRARLLPSLARPVPDARLSRSCRPLHSCTLHRSQSILSRGAWNSYLFFFLRIGGTEHGTAHTIAQGRPTTVGTLTHSFGKFSVGRSLYRRPLRLEPLEDRRLLATVTVTTIARHGRLQRRRHLAPRGDLRHEHGPRRRHDRLRPGPHRRRPGDDSAHAGRAARSPIRSRSMARARTLDDRRQRERSDAGCEQRRRQSSVEH